jgi:hypothetical protein
MEFVYGYGSVIQLPWSGRLFDALENHSSQIVLIKSQKSYLAIRTALKPRLANPPERVTSKGGKRRIKEVLHLPPP